MLKSLASGVGVVLLAALVLSGCQLFKGKGEVSEESSSIEVVPVTPSEQFNDVMADDVQTVELSQPETVEGEEAEEESADQSGVSGSLRYFIENARVTFSVMVDETALEETESETSNLFVWIKKDASEWQKVCQIVMDKGGLQCGGSLSTDDLPVDVGVVRGSTTQPSDGSLLLQGRIQAEESAEEAAE